MGQRSDMVEDQQSRARANVRAVLRDHAIIETGIGWPDQQATEALIDDLVDLVMHHVEPLIEQVTS